MLEYTFSKSVAASLATGAFLVPVALSMSTAPTPLHPRVLLWYGALRKPWFKPPDVAVPIMWAVIEVALAIGGYRLFRSKPSPARARAIIFWAWNVTAIGGWSRLFFGQRNLPASTIAAASMVVTGAAYVREAQRVDEPAAWAGVPFVAWVGFAAVLTAALWRLNRATRK